MTGASARTVATEGINVGERDIVRRGNDRAVTARRRTGRRLGVGCRQSSSSHTGGAVVFVDKGDGEDDDEDNYDDGDGSTGSE